MLPLAGEWTLDGFSRHVERLDLFPAGAPQFSVWRRYRRWSLESAALDLALRQAGRSLAAALEREPSPVSFVVSCGLGSPPSQEPVQRRLAIDPGTRFKLDAAGDWEDDLIAWLAGTGTVAVIDFKSAYKGADLRGELSQFSRFFAPETDAGLYRRVAEAFPDAWLEDS